MKSFVIAVCIFACAYAANLDQDAQIVRSLNEQSPEGNFQYGFEADNGIIAQAQGVLKTYGKDEVAIEVTGSNSYKSPEGETFQLSYTADENGYRPVGAHLPTPPAPEPIPDYILRSLEYIAAHPYTEKTN